MGLTPAHPNCKNILKNYGSCVLVLFRNQGAILPSVTPETLLDYEDYLQWFSSGKLISPKNIMEFNYISMKAWTSVLMQTIKVNFRVFYSIMTLFYLR